MLTCMHTYVYAHTHAHILQSPLPLLAPKLVISGRLPKALVEHDRDAVDPTR